jgi:hypothetical protein
MVAGADESRRPLPVRVELRPQMARGEDDRARRGNFGAIRLSLFTSGDAQSRIPTLILSSLVPEI